MANLKLCEEIHTLCCATPRPPSIELVSLYLFIPRTPLAFQLKGYNFDVSLGDSPVCTNQCNLLIIAATVVITWAAGHI